MATQFLAGIAVVWLICGVVTATVMRSRGHDFFRWLSLGVVLGPLVLGIAIEAVRTEKQSGPTKPAQPSNPHHILVGIDGSPESLGALDTALGLVDKGTTTVTLVTVLDFDTPSSVTGQHDQEEALSRLNRLAETLTTVRKVNTGIVIGRPDQALSDHARTVGAGLVVVGARGAGLSEALFGSTAESLVSKSSVPVLVGHHPNQARLPNNSSD